MLALAAPVLYLVAVSISVWNNSGNMKVSEESTDALFQQHSITEIQDIEKKLRNDIEKKKEDLRQMVGERYQDLINAADTITEMKNSTESVTKHISSMENWCSNIYSEMGPSGILQKCSFKCSQKLNNSGPVFALASQLKLLMDVPTLLWWSLDESRYLKASQILRLAEHVHLSLTLDAEGHFQSMPLSAAFPVFSNQMSTIRKFRRCILQRARSEMKTGHVTHEVLVDIVCSMLLLGDTTLENIFHDFLRIRMNTIKDIKDSAVKGSTVKDQICELIGLITNTISLVDQVFLLKNSDEPAILQKTLSSLSSLENQGPIKYFQIETSATYRYLPQQITDYRPSLESKLTALDHQLCHESIKQWINEVKVALHDILVNLLCYVTRVKGLSAISDAVDQLMQEPENCHWTELCNHVLQQDFPIYDELLQAVIVDRIKVLCQERIGSCFLDCQNNLLSILSSLRKTKQSVHDLESNLTQYLWIESAEDIQNLPIGIQTSTEPYLNPGSLAMKASSYTPQVQSLCAHLDKSIGSLLEDIKHFGSFSEDSTMKHNSEMVELRLYVREILIQDIQKIMKTVQEIIEQNDEHDIITCYPFLSRFARGLTDLCPNIKSCFTVMSPGISKIDSKWDEVKLDILSTCDEAFRKWGLHFTRKHLCSVALGLESISPASFLQNTLEWDEIEIDEETEEGKPVKSVIRLPMQASMFLTTALFNICREINLRIGHVLPRPICQELRVQALQFCLESYESSLPSLSTMAVDSPRFAQTLALQLLFDVQFMAGFFAVKEHPTLVEQLNKLVIALEELVDPFDLDVFHPHLQTNLAMALQRSTLLLGLLCQERSVSTQRLASGRNQSFNLLPTTVGVGRFMTLPVSCSSKVEDLPLEVKTISSPKLARSFGSSPSLQNTSTSEPETTNVTKSYSFLSAMGASWFGSN